MTRTVCARQRRDRRAVLEGWIPIGRARGEPGRAAPPFAPLRAAPAAGRPRLARTTRALVLLQE